MKSFQLLRTNPLLTTNIKIDIDTNLKIYLSSIKSNSTLNNENYKHFSINRESLIEKMFPMFYKSLPKEHAFFVKNDDDDDVIYNDYSHQFDDIYFSGSNYISDKWYEEEFEYFAPLYIKKNKLPSGFIILRIDDPSVYSNTNGIYDLDVLNNKNFREEIIDKWKCVSYYDMTDKTDLGYWLNNNINNNDRFPNQSFDLNIKNISLPRWFGIDYDTGVYTQKTMYISNDLMFEQPHFKFEKMITEGFKKNSLIYPHILNFNFLFNDNPATPEKLKKYSINRYMGFYVDKFEFVTNLTSYITPKLKNNTILINNIISSGNTYLNLERCDYNFNDNDINSINPFIDENWDDNKNYFIYIKNDLYQVIRFIENDKYYYKILSDTILDNDWNPSIVYNKTININYDKDHEFSYLEPIDNNFTIDPYINCNNQNKDMYADLYLIKINDKYHVIKNGKNLDNNNSLKDKYYLQCDYAITSNSNKLETWIGGKTSKFFKSINIENENEKPLVYSIYKITFTEIKDFDFNRINTKFSDFDYEQSNYTEIKEEKLYSVNYKSNTYPKPYKKGKKGNIDQDKPIAVSSEYVASNELYENNNGKISDIWKKNQSVCKWGFQNSISHSDYSYKLNNNKNIGNIFNRTTDVFSNKADIYKKNLDYFYRIGNLIDSNNNPIYYLNQTTNIQTEFLNGITNGYSLNGGDGFNIGIYFEKDVPSNFNFDYFDFFFNNKMYKKNKENIIIDTYKKYSEFYVNEYNQCVTLFKGIKFIINESIKIKRNTINGLIEKITSDNKGLYDNYKFSIILNDVYYLPGSGKPYKVNGLVNYNNIINIIDDGIHIILNDIYKNILIIINVKIELNINNNETFNYVSIFNEKDGLYDNLNISGNTASPNYNSDKLTALNFINAINDPNNKYGFDNFIKYYHIKKEDNITIIDEIFINDDINYKTPPFILTIDKPDKINLKKTYDVKINKDPKLNKLFNKSINKFHIPDEEISVEFKQSSININKTIYRYSGSYEPIFKDINLFKKAIFCYTDYSSGITLESDFINKESISCLSIKDDNILQKQIRWFDTELICSILNKNTYVYNNLPQFNNNPQPFFTEYLIFKNFDFHLPINSTINGITLSINRKSHTLDVSSPNNRYIKDDSVFFVKDINDYLNISGMTINSAHTDNWETSYITKLYGGNNILWDWIDGSSWNSSIVNSNKFGLVIRCELNNSLNNAPNVPTYDIFGDIKCVNIRIDYSYNKKHEYFENSIYFNKNQKFDETIDNFGNIDEIIYSKVNIDNINILKMDIAKYSKLDQFGYSYNNRFIFKSDWDKNYYFNTLNSFTDDDIKYTDPNTKLI